MPYDLKDGYWEQLLKAVKYNEAEEVQKLIEGVDVQSLSTHQYGARGNTLLIEAVRSGNEETIDVLLRKGIDVNVSSKMGKTALGAYVPTNEEQCVKANRINQKLIDAGAIDKTGEYTKSPLIQAIQRNDLEEVKKLVAQGDVNANNKDKRPLWSYALKKPEILKVLCDAGMNLETKNGHGHTALMAALYEDNDDVARDLIKAGANVNAKSEGKLIEGYTPLYFVKTKEMAEELIRAGADVNAVAQDGETPIIGKQLEVMKVLHENGASLEVQSSSGQTLMAQAAMVHDIEKIKYLQEQGLNINAPDSNGYKPIKYAVASKGMMMDFSILNGMRLFKKADPDADFVQKMIDAGAKVMDSGAMEVVGENLEASAIKKILKNAAAQEKKALKKELSMQRKVAEGSLKKAQKEIETVVLDGNAEKSAKKTTEVKVQLFNQGRE